jgi:hypothetical protein
MESRTLLVSWKEYIKKYNFTKEPFESFDFIQNETVRKDYVSAKTALDNISGSREFLKNYNINHSENTIAFSDGLGAEIISSFEHTRIRDARSVAWNYRYLLNMWDNFVEDTKHKELREVYDAKQIHVKHINNFSYVGNNKLNAIIEAEKIKNMYNLDYSINTIIDMLHALVHAQHEEHTTQIKIKLKKNTEERISILAHHYKHPERWNDSSNGSSAFGNPMDITEEMIGALEEIYPDYRMHIKLIQAKFA